MIVYYLFMFILFIYGFIIVNKYLFIILTVLQPNDTKNKNSNSLKLEHHFN